MSDLQRRLESLSPEQRSLLEQRLRSRGVELPGAASAAGSEPVLQRRGLARAPASIDQDRLWLVEQLTPGNPVYNLATLLHYRGRLQPRRLQAVLQQLIERHESLRTRLVAEEGKPWQVIEPHWRVPLCWVDLQGLPPSMRKAEQLGLARRWGRQPFRLDCLPLWRLLVLRREPDRDALAGCFAHIFFDHVSGDIFLRELQQLYVASSAALPSLPIQFADFATWQRERLQGATLERLRAYWSRRLDGAPGLLELPTDRPRPAMLTYRGARRPLRLPAAHLQRLQQLGGQATPFAALTALWRVLLFRLSGQRDFVLGAPSVNRGQDELAGLIGYFVDLLVLRGQVEPGKSFRELLRAERETVMGAIAHQEMPFSMLVQEFATRRDPSFNPLFQASVNYVPEGEQDPASAWRGEEVYHGTSTFDLILVVAYHGAGDGVGHIEYSTDLFDVSTIGRLERQLRHLLGALVSTPDVPVEHVELMPIAEGHQVLLEWNATAASRPVSSAHELQEAPAFPKEPVFECVVVQARAQPDAIALRTGDAHVSYGELIQRAQRLAVRLRRRGIGTAHGGGEAVVLVWLPRGPDFVIAALACWWVGAAYLPADPEIPPARLHLLATDARVPLLLTDRQRAATDLTDLPRLLLPSAGKAEMKAAAARMLPTRGALEARGLAYVVTTSGSTGRPKGVGVTHGSLARLVHWHLETFQPRPGEACSWSANPAFDASAWEVWYPLAVGATVCPLPSGPADVSEVASWVSRQALRHLFLPTPLAQELLTRALDVPLRFLFAGGDRLRRPPASSSGRAPWSLWNLYGPTEATVICAAGRVDASELREPTIGRPLPALRLVVLNSSLQPQPIGVAGELGIAEERPGVALARGYLRRPAQTAEVFVPDPTAGLSGNTGARLYRTGDQVRWLPDGRLDFLGRLDTQVKVRGFRIELGEIEYVLASHPAVAEALVVTRTLAGGSRQLLAYARLTPAPATATPNELRAFLEARLPVYMVPSALLVLDTWPLTERGKIDRTALPLPATAGGAALEPSDGDPDDPLQLHLARLWAELLAVPVVGTGDNVFELGADSILASRLVARARQQGLRLEVADVFQAQTVAGQVRRLRRAAAAGVDIPLIAQPRAELPQLLPMSAAQRRMWLLDRLLASAGQSGQAYHISGAFDLQRPGQPMDVAALERAFGRLIERHETLRTTFVLQEDGEPCQRIAPPGVQSHGPRLPVVDLGLLAAADRDAERQRLTDRHAILPFDLETGPLQRILLLRTDPSSYRLCLTQHHILSDAWSLGVLLGELSTLMTPRLKTAALKNGASLPALPVQYADYAVWQEAWLDAGARAAQLDYWRRTLAGLPTLELPADRPRPPVATQHGAAHELRLEASDVRALEALGRRHGATLSMVLLTVFQLLLRRLSGTPEVVVGTLTANRHRAEVQGLIGFFVNTLVLRTGLQEVLSISAALECVRDTALAAYAHQDLPFEALVEALRPERDPSRNPLFQVLYTLDTTDAGGLQLEGIEVQPAPVVLDATRFDLELQLSRQAEGKVVGALVYNTDLFDTTTTRRWLVIYQRLIAAVAIEPETMVDTLPWWSPAERHQVMTEWGQAPPNGEWGTADAGHPDRIAVVHGDHRVSYRELHRRAAVVAGHLQARGVGPEVRVGVCLPRTPDLLVAILGVLASGGAYLPLDPAYPAERLRFMAEDAGVALTLASLRDIDFTGDFTGDAAPFGDVFGDADPDTLAYVIYTSGSTGRPKGVGIARRNVQALLAWARDAYAPAELQGVLAATSVCFDVSVFELLAPLTTGGTLLLVENALERQALRAAEEVTLVSTVPSVLHEWLHTAPLHTAPLHTAPLHTAPLHTASLPPAVRTINLAGEALSPALVERLRQRTNATLWNLYGPTEDTIFSTGLRLHTALDPLPIGRPIGSLVRVLDAASWGGGPPVPVGAVGELCLGDASFAEAGGAGLARGYLGRPGLTAERFVPDALAQGRPGSRLYRTGDLVRYRADGQLLYLGRRDQQVKLRGFRIELGEIESVLSRHAAVQAAATSVVDQQLHAWAVLQEGEGEEIVDALRAHLVERLPAHLVPAVVHVVDALPRTSSGKLDRNALRERVDELATQHSGASGREGSKHAPRTEIERKLLALWTEVLDAPDPGIRDSFFQLGGHSLLAVRLMARIRDDLGAELPLSMLFLAPTVEQLARHVEPSRREDGAAEVLSQPAVVPIQPLGSQPPIFCVAPIMGTVFPYYELARELGDDQPFFGLQPPALDEAASASGVRQDSIGKAATDFLDAVRQVRPNGPYRVAGWSFGGLVAYEMACLLAEEGIDVELILLDTPAPVRSQRQKLWPALKMFYRVVVRNFLPYIRDYVYLRSVGDRSPEAGGFLRRLGEGAALAAAVPEESRLADFHAPQLRAMLAAMRDNARAMGKYRPHPYAGKALLLRTEQSGKGGLGWEELVTGGVDIVPIPGNHMTLLRPPHVREVASKLRDFLAPWVGG